MNTVTWAVFESSEPQLAGHVSARLEAGINFRGWVTFEFLVGEVLSVSNDAGEITRVRWKAPAT